MRHSLTIIETAIASQALMGMILPQTSLKHKNHNEPSTEQYIKKEKINMIDACVHENFSPVKETNRF
ncbi:hypothetical protein ACLGDE_04155 [Helicobacter pylori]